MRQFILGKKVAYATQNDDLTTVADGAVGFYYNDNGQLKVDADGTKITKECMLVVGRPKANGGPIVIPIYKNKFSYAKSVYSAAVQFATTLIVTQPTKVGDYTIIVAKKGVGFNERNKWSATVHVTDVSMTANDLATALRKAINSNSSSSGVTAEGSTIYVVIKGVVKGTDYQIIPADLLTGIKSINVTAGTPALNDAKYITDLANKAAADAGFEYTYQNDVNLLYPNYPLNPLAKANTIDTGFIVYTMKFAEPREVKTVDEVVNQVVQLAVPTGTTVTEIEKVLDALSGKVTPAA